MEFQDVICEDHREFIGYVTIRYVRTFITLRYLRRYIKRLQLYQTLH